MQLIKNSKHKKHATNKKKSKIKISKNQMVFLILFFCLRQTDTPTHTHTELYIYIDCGILTKQEMESLPCDLTPCHLCQFFTDLRRGRM